MFCYGGLEDVLPTDLAVPRASWLIQHVVPHEVVYQIHALEIRVVTESKRNVHKWQCSETEIHKRYRRIVAHWLHAGLADDEALHSMHEFVRNTQATTRLSTPRIGDATKVTAGHVAAETRSLVHQQWHS